MFELPSYPGAANRKTTPLHDQVLASLATRDAALIGQLIFYSSPNVIQTAFKPGFERKEALYGARGFSRICFEDTQVDLGVGIPYSSFVADAFIQVPLIIDGYKEKLTVLVEIKTEVHSLSEVLDQIGRYKSKLNWGIRCKENNRGYESILLICPKLEDHERIALTRQSTPISVFTNFELTGEVWKSTEFCRGYAAAANKNK